MKELFRNNLLNSSFIPNDINTKQSTICRLFCIYHFCNFKFQRFYKEGENECRRKLIVMDVNERGDLQEFNNTAHAAPDLQRLFRL